MALQQFVKGLQAGLGPSAQATIEDKRRLKLMENIANLRFKEQQKLDEYEHQLKLDRFKKALSGIQDVPQGTAGLLAAGQDPTKFGLEMPLGERGQEMYDLDKRTKEANIEYLEGRGDYYGAGRTQRNAIPEEFRRAQEILGSLQDELKMYAPKRHYDRETNQIIEDPGNPEAFQRTMRRIEQLRSAMYKGYDEIAKYQSPEDMFIELQNSGMTPDEAFEIIQREYPGQFE